MRRPLGPVALGSATFMLAGLTTFVSAGPAHAAGPLSVRTTGADTGNCQSTPCLTLQYAVTQAASLTGDVIIRLGPGTYDPPAAPAGGVVVPAVFAGDRLTIQGAGRGAGGTVLHTGDDGTGGGWGIQVLTDKPVTVTDLRVTEGTPPAAVTNSSTTPSLLVGIYSDSGAATAALTAVRTRVDGLTGTTGPTGCSNGGTVFGVLALAGDLTVTDSAIRNLVGGLGGSSNTGAACAGGVAQAIGGFSAVTLTDVEISRLRGGSGGTGGGALVAGPGGGGGPAIGIQSLGSLAMTRTAISNLQGGTGGVGGPVALGPSAAPGGDGGTAGGVQARALSVVDSQVSDVSAGTGGAGGAGNGTTAGGAGGAGGSLALGIDAFSGAFSVTGTTVAHIAAGVGGAGGAGTTAGAAGHPGAKAVGIASEDSGAAGTVDNSTVTDVHGPIDPTVLAYGVGTRGTLTLTHVTVTDSNNGVLGDPGATIKLAATLLNNPVNCAPGTPAVTDLGGNVASDGTCALGPGSDSAHVFTPGELGALGDNGGPTETIALSPHSSAARQVPVSSGFCTGTDQRGPGFVRPGVGGPNFCAAGAFEPQRPRPPAHAPAGSIPSPDSDSTFCGAVTHRPVC